MKNRNETIDLLKFIFSICIIMIHAQLFKSQQILYSTITMGLARIAVPFFFITSGYYFYQKVYLKQDVRSYFMKIIKLYLVFELIEVLIYTIPLLPTIQKYGVLPYLWKIMSVGLGGIYWYLISLILSLLILLPFWKKHSIIPLLCMSLVLYLLVFTNDSYGFYFENTTLQNISKLHTYIWTWPQAGLCSSLFYLSLGALIYQLQPRVSYLSLKLFLSIICLMVEACFLQTHGAYDGNCYLMLMITTPLLFLWALQHETLNINTIFLSKLSIYIYMIHPIVLNIIQFIFHISSFLLFIVTTIITICIAYMVICLKNHINKVS